MRLSVSTTAVILYAALIAFLSLHPTVGSEVGNWDKLYHSAAYFVFAILGYRVAKTESGYLAVCTGIFTFSCSMEIAQFFIPGRDMSAQDVMANAAGILVGWTFTKAFSKLVGWT